MGNCFVASSSLFISPSSSPAAEKNKLQNSVSSAAQVNKRGGDDAVGVGSVVPKDVAEFLAIVTAGRGGGDDVIVKNSKDDSCNYFLSDTSFTFTYRELREATKNFRPDQILGEGGFGIVYKGSIIIDDTTTSSSTQLLVAVKVLNPEGFQGDREWLTEVNYLGQLSHPNLVKLIGYCCEGTHRLLVYEYMACGSLEKHLFRRVCLTMSWSARMKIALGAAKGLAFLHGAKRPIIYRDFKTSNILLDADYNAKLSDFGLAKEGPMGDQTHVSTRVMGTYGYAAPEYVMTGHLTARSDVYGFGVVLLEMLIGRKAVDKNRPSREHNLVEWARPLLIHNKKLLKIVDPRLEGQYTNKTLQKVASLAYHCLSQNPKGRPDMSQVVEMLESLPEGRDDFLLLSQQSCGGAAAAAAITLYEAPEQKQIPPAEDGKEEEKEKKCMSTNQGGRETKSEANNKVHRRRRRAATSANGRSRSEPPTELQVFITSPDSESSPPQPPTLYS